MEGQKEIERCYLPRNFLFAWRILEIHTARQTIIFDRDIIVDRLKFTC